MIICWPNIWLKLFHQAPILLFIGLIILTFHSVYTRYIIIQFISLIAVRLRCPAWNMKSDPIKACLLPWYVTRFQIFCTVKRNNGLNRLVKRYSRRFKSPCRKRDHDGTRRALGISKDSYERKFQRNLVRILRKQRAYKKPINYITCRRKE